LDLMSANSLNVTGKAAAARGMQHAVLADNKNAVSASSLL